MSEGAQLNSILINRVVAFIAKIKINHFDWHFILIDNFLLGY